MCRREERGEVAATVASGEPPKLVGRGVELGRLTELLDGARDGTTGAIVVLGEAGIGKTTLLDAVAARADGFLRLRARGIESEEALGHAALLELLRPVRDVVGCRARLG
jgi:hypothetical protein